MDTDQFRKAYTDYRKVEASVLSSQSSQWDLHAVRQNVAIDMATIKRPAFRSKTVIEPVDTQETKKLYPKSVDDLLPLESTFTVKPNSGTTKLFLDQWKQGLGLPLRDDDAILEQFKVTRKRQFIDNYKSIATQQRSQEFKNNEGNSLLALCMNLYAAVLSSASRGPLLRIAKNVYDETVKYNQTISPNVLKSIYDVLSRLTNTTSTGRLDLRIAKFSTIVDAAPKPSNAEANATNRGGAVGDPKTVPDPKGKTDAAPPAEAPPAAAPPAAAPPAAAPGAAPGAAPAAAPKAAPGAPKGPPKAAAPAPVVETPKEAAIAILPITDEAIIRDTIVQDDSRPLTLVDLNTVKDYVQKSKDLIMTAYSSKQPGETMRDGNVSYSVVDSILPRGTQNMTQSQYVLQLQRLADQNTQAKSLKEQEEAKIKQGLSVAQAVKETVPDLSKNTQDMAIANAETNAATAITNTETTLPPPEPYVPPAGSPAAAAQANPVAAAAEAGETEEGTAAEPDTEAAAKETAATEAAATEAATKAKEGETKATSEKLKDKPFTKQIPDLIKFYEENKGLKPGKYKTTLLALIDSGEDDLKDIGIHNFFHVQPNNWKAFWEKEISYLKNLKPETLAKAPDTAFSFTKNGFEKKYSNDDAIRTEMNRLDGAGHPKRARSSSSVTYAPGYQSKKDKKAKKMKH
jgi:hypothetical protein